MTTAMRRHPSFVAGCGLVGLWLAAVLLSLAWTPYPPTEIDVPNRLLLPSAAHWLGTDSLGRDIASLLIVGARTSLLVGVAAVGLGALLGTAIGVLGAARRGWLDALLMRAADFSFAFPALLTAMMLAALAGPGAATAVAAIAVFNAAVFARISRSAAGAVWSRDFVLAARACGRDRWQITLDHVLPNIAAPLIVQATIQFAVAILAEAALSYLGLGVRPPQPSWGRMLNEAQEMMFQAPQLALYPGIAIALAVLGLNLVGDGLRDLLDPRLVTER
ncbi:MULTISPECIES: ABC transporter permease [unclassified Rhizobacter]|uniref:ABC transporter permease n=1 Tax=unclassified Rhizobacter TaxID=2640088 RepID=UPI0006FC5248|nr:peptide ABC transporter permease [Rhizobacter sp. Root29]KQW10976.1 peptide ABC transporter permease [Rhizobacter sp. Root1238]KRB25322.1 peptide ABC transporter permease [Rhizobacter sp. Root16D2]